MPGNTNKLAKALGAKVVAKLPDTGSGAFGAARLGKIVSELSEQLKPGSGARPGRPTDPQWVLHPKIPMSKRTEQKLKELAKKASTPQRKVSPMQLAARLLEDALE